MNINTDVRPVKKRFVIDTTALISYFDAVFEQGSQISKKGVELIKNAF